MPSAPAVEVPETDVAMHKLAIVHGALNAELEAPSGAAQSLRFGVTQVSTADGNFAIAIERARGPLSDRKQVIDENPHNKLSKYVVESPDALLYESQRAGSVEYHVLVHARVAGVVYECRNRKERSYSLPEAGSMLRACRSLAGVAQ